MAIDRIYVEKRPAHAVEAGAVLGDLRSVQGIANLKSVRILNRYDVEGADAKRSSASAVRTRAFRAAAWTLIYEDSCRRGEGVPGVRRGVPARPVRPAGGLRRPVHPASRPAGSGPVVRHGPGVSCLGGGCDRRRPCSRCKKYLINPVESARGLPGQARNPGRGTTPAPDHGARRWRASSALDEDGLASLLCRSTAWPWTQDDLAFCQDYFRDGGAAGPHHHRAARDRHLLVRSLPPHHLLHPHRRGGASRTPAVEEAYKQYLDARRGGLWRARRPSP